MKLLTIAIPCYNSEAYMRNCIEALLPGGEEVEILIIDDGSTKDRTAEIADEYQEKYPSIVRAIHQENKGHGGAVNTGIDNAKGLYFKVVDSDDKLELKAYLKVLANLEYLVRSGQSVDMFLANYVYDKVDSKKRVMRYPKFMPEEKVFTWKDMKHIDQTHYVLMHSIIYRTQVLRECGLRLPEHTFYVDNLYAFIPIPYVKKLYYLNVDLYWYFIGRADQSVNESVMISRIDQQFKVNEMMIDYIGECKGLASRQWDFMMHALSIIMAVSTSMALRSGSKESLERKNELWKRLQRVSAPAYLHSRFGLTGLALNLPTKAGRKISILGYKLAQKLYGFN